MSKLGDHIEYVKGFAFKSKDYTETGIPVIRVSNFTDNSIDIKDVYHIPKERFSEFQKVNLIKDDIVIATVGSWPTNPSSVVGKTIRVPPEANNTLLNQNAVRIRSLDKDEQLYFYYVLKDKSFSDYIISTAQGSANQASITLKSILDYDLPNIDSKEKRIKIGKTLATYDEKIQLNTQINQTLEQIAQALFKSWFVDFEPVRAKVQALSDGLSLEQAELAAMQAISGKTPEELTALSQTQPDRYAELAETAKAFPCEMVEVDGVEVPKGWRIGTFTDITESRREKVKNDKAMVLSAVSSGELVKSEEYFTKQVFSKSIDKYLKVYKWDFAYNPARINIGSIGLHEADYLGAVSPVYEVFSVSDKYHWFLKRILNLETTKIKIQSLCTGSVRQTLKLKDFQSIDCVIPDEKTLSIFNKKWEEYRTLILENNKNTQTLSEIRDLLLPRLLSGKIEND